MRERQLVAVTTDVPPVAVWSMAAIGWGLRGGISTIGRLDFVVW